MNTSILQLWGTMGWFARSIVFVLFLMSLVSLSVAIHRGIDLWRSRRATLRFAPLLSEALELQDFDRGEAAVANNGVSHLAGAYRGVFQALRNAVADGTITAVEVGATQRTMELNKLEQIARFRRGLGVLATVGATAPFVGLLGTTMGVVHSFTGMANAGSAGLGAISAGIAEALITTAIGLFVAIPSVWLYNYLVNRVEFISMEIDYGSKEFMNFLLLLEARLQRGEVVGRAISATAPTRAPEEAGAHPLGAAVPQGA